MFRIQKDHIFEKQILRTVMEKNMFHPNLDTIPKAQTVSHLLAKSTESRKTRREAQKAKSIIWTHFSYSTQNNENKQEVHTAE
jgi:hypothetical protein